ncbi:MAG: hypothetical protein WD382_11700 [Halofilum sp. (in: g-proteobacteria)]
MHVTRVYADANGESHFAEIDIPLTDGGTIGAMSERLPAHGVIFRENEPGYDFDWHCAPRRQYIVLLDGEIELTVSDGETREFAGGDVLLVEDTTGKGHRTRNIKVQRRRSLFIPLEPEN